MMLSMTQFMVLYVFVLLQNILNSLKAIQLAQGCGGGHDLLSALVAGCGTSQRPSCNPGLSEDHALADAMTASADIAVPDGWGWASAGY